MARILVTGSTQGLGRATAAALLGRGHRVVVHARDEKRAGVLHELVRRGADVVVGDLASHEQTRALADQVNALGRMEAVVHNAGVYAESPLSRTPEGHPHTLAVNVLAPYLLTALLQPPKRLVYLSSGMHRSGDPSLRDLNWNDRRWNATQAYCDSKLFVTSLAFAVARRWPQVRSNRGPRLGPHPHGRPGRTGRPRGRPHHPGGARRWRRLPGGGNRAALVPPAASATGARDQRPRIPGPAAQNLGRADRGAPVLGTTDHLLNSASQSARWSYPSDVEKNPGQLSWPN